MMIWSMGGRIIRRFMHHAKSAGAVAVTDLVERNSPVPKGTMSNACSAAAPRELQASALARGVGRSSRRRIITARVGNRCEVAKSGDGRTHGSLTEIDAGVPQP